MLIVNSPSNPTGWMISVDEQRALLELAAQHDLVILADEVYERLVYDDKPEVCRHRTKVAPQVAPSFARVAGNRDRLIVVNSFSKTYNMTGWRLGWAQGERGDDQDDVPGRGVHDLEPGRHGAAGRHRRVARRRAVHRATCARTTPAAARR